LQTENPDINNELLGLVLKSLAQNPEDRFQSSADFQYQLNKYLILNFPNFRPFHFDEFIKNFYSLVIQERSDKLSKLSKIKISEPKKSEPDEIVEFSPVNRYINPETDFHNEKQNEKNASDVELPDGFGSHSQLYKNFEKNKQSSKKSHQFDKLDKQNPFAGEIKYYPKQKVSVFYANERLQAPEADLEPSLYTELIENTFIGNYKHLIILFLFFVSTFSLYKYFFETKSSDFAAESVITNEEIPRDPSSQVYSQQRAISATDDFSTSIYRKLKASSKLAYVNIRVMNSNSNVKIFIDNRELIERSPIRAYPIYANTVTKISAYDIKTKHYAEKKVSIQSGKVLNLQLHLQPYTNRNK
jgi:serine/threonine protein kinase